jgi:hypothetical protein
MPKLRLHSPASIAGIGSVLEIPGEDVSVGRSPDNQLVIAESSVSLHHARLRKTADGWLLTDLGQSNGIWVGIQRVSELVLCPGQLFRIGGVALEFVDEAGGAESATVPHPTVGSVAAKTEQDSIVRGFASVESKDPTFRDLSPLPALVSQQPALRPQSEFTATRKQRRGGTALRRFFVGLLTMAVLGATIAVGGYFTLRWMSRTQTRARVLPSAPAPISVPPVVSAPVLPEALLVDKEVANVAEVQEIEIPNALKLVLPGGALHTPTHLVVVRAGHQGSPFCAATEYASTAYEISTLGNSTWAQVARVEFSVDVEQLAKTRVPAVAVGLFDSNKQAWSLLPTEYDSVRRVAKAQFWQPGLLALFMVNGSENIATSEHFSLLLEPGANTAKAVHERASKALVQLESALSKYRAAGYRVPTGSLWVCASSSAISRARALLPVVNQSDLGRAHNHALARAAFLNLVPAYVGARALEGREFWFDALASAIASQSLGQHLATSAPSSKRLSNSLLADDWPSTPLFVSVLARILDAKIDLFRLWTDTAHVMSELDAKPNSEMQSRVLPIDMALEGATQKSLLAYQASLVADRLSSALAPGASGQSSSSDFCPSPTRVSAGTSGVLKLDVPNQYSARWACLLLDVPAGKYRSVHIQLASEVPPGLSVQLIRAVTGQSAEVKPLSALAERVDFQRPELLVVSAVNSNMAQSHSISLRYEDVTLDARFDNVEPSTVRPGQVISNGLQVSRISPDIKGIDVEWDFADGAAKPKSTHPVSGNARAEQSHAWDRPGIFTLRATLFDHDRPTQPIGVATREITVQPVQLELHVSDPNPQPSTDVKFVLKPLGPAPEKLQFRFNFGDGSDQAIVSSLEITHAFVNPGEYAVTAQMVGEMPVTEVLATAKLVITVKAADAPTALPSVAPPTTVPPQASSPSVQ